MLLFGFGTIFDSDRHTLMDESESYGIAGLLYQDKCFLMVKP